MEAGMSALTKKLVGLFSWAFSGLGIPILILGGRKVLSFCEQLWLNYQLKKFEGVYLLCWQKEDRRIWHGSFVGLEYISSGQFRVMGRRPGDHNWSWNGHLELRKTARHIVGKGRYKYLFRDNDSGRQNIYCKKDGSLRVIVDNLSVPRGKRNFHTVWVPISDMALDCDNRIPKRGVSYKWFGRSDQNVRGRYKIPFCDKGYALQKTFC